MKIRPCIDIHNGRVKQIIGSTLTDPGTVSAGPGSVFLQGPGENYVSDRGAAYYAGIYKKEGLPGGHIILLNPSSDAGMYQADLNEARQALKEYPEGMQIGGGITAENAPVFLSYGASHVIVTSYVFHDGKLDPGRLNRLKAAVGREKLVLDLSCRKKEDGAYYVVTDRWQKFTDLEVNSRTLEYLAGECAEFLIHAADVEGKKMGIDLDLCRILGHFASGTGFPVVYAGGIHAYDDLDLAASVSDGAVDVTVGSALDLFGGSLSLSELKDRAERINKNRPLS
ncbi:MAG: phosphoribosylformimino-5-aminoimidazole carboxamide ribotide isomerase [Lachnospiraceae bacterium]|nr:phosphoribosylformimino-5-aminoimidazole carboxamide ribotide isomerase [Lachnospiraceae bacterium]